jgi:rod shape-determining protein MreD
MMQFPNLGQGMAQLIQGVDQSPQLRSLVGGTLTVMSVWTCLMLLPMRLPGTTLAGISPNWLLIWVVAWSLRRSSWQAVSGGLVLGLLQDSMTEGNPTHALSLMFVAFLTTRIQKQRFLNEDFISVALVTFGMAVVAETIMALQFSFVGNRTLIDIWRHHQIIALSSAVLSSLWAPVLYFPLNNLWKWSGIPDNAPKPRL